MSTCAALTTHWSRLGKGRCTALMSRWPSLPNKSRRSGERRNTSPHASTAVRIWLSASRRPTKSQSTPVVRPWCLSRRDTCIRLWLKPSTRSFVTWRPSIKREWHWSVLAPSRRPSRPTVPNQWRTMFCSLAAASRLRPIRIGSRVITCLLIHLDPQGIVMRLDEARLIAVNATRTTTAKLVNCGPEDAWRREMERQQAEAWFPGALTPQRLPAPDFSMKSSKRAEPPGKPVSQVDARTRETKPSAERQFAGSSAAQAAWHRQDAPTLVFRPSAAGGSPAHGVAGIGTGTGSPPRVAEAQVVPVLPPHHAPFTVRDLTWALNVSKPTSQVLVHPSDAPALARSAPTDESDFAVRVHVEGDARASTVWLGVDADALAQLPAIAQTVARWLARQGYGPTTWVCNGQLLQQPLEMPPRSSSSAAVPKTNLVDSVPGEPV